MSDSGYVNYFEILGLTDDAKPGEVRKTYRKKMKDLVIEIARTQITEEKRAQFLLEMAKLNAAFYLLRDNESRDAYWSERSALVDLEARWIDAVEENKEEADRLRRDYDARLKSFLSKYVEELMLEAGRDKDCVEASHWNVAHERHASRLLRHYRHRLNQEILERLPYSETTRPQVDWDERRGFAETLLSDAVRNHG